jgi:signal transduction histidine kinase
MRRPDGIRRKIWAVFIQQMVAISLSAMLGVYVAVTLVENFALRQIVGRETDAIVQRLADDPATRPAGNSFLQSWLVRTPQDAAQVPEFIRSLTPGFHHQHAGQHYAALVTDTSAGRLYVVFVQKLVYLSWLGSGLVLIVLIVAGSTAVMAYRASRRALAPVVVLADTVRAWDPNQPDVDALLPENLPLNVEVDSDVASLARALHGFATRLEDFVERERNFTRDASHELRTPLTVIKVGADILLDEEDLPPFTRRTAGRVRRAARDMEALIDSFLILAREDGVGLPEEDFTINEAVREEVERAQPLVDDKPVHLSLEEKAVFGLHTSPRAFGVLVGNLIRNACMYTERGAVTVTIDTGCVLVRDTGIGMSEEDLAHVFESFYRGRSKGEGHGIGLSIVKRLSDRFGWDINIASKLGVGTTIRVGFPVAADR